MCGIAAYFNKDGITSAELHRALSGLDALRHRGPNGEGAVLINARTGTAQTLQLPEAPEDLTYDLQIPDYQDKSANLILMHRRLSIFDLSSQGHQPMCDEGGNWIIFNGEVYNFIEIREELNQKGHTFRSGTDTEVILAAYREWGADCLKRFTGMWTIILFDQKQQQLFISNDRFGIKALYGYTDGTRAAFSSEVKSFLHFQVGTSAYNQENIQAFLSSGLIDYDDTTLYRDIFRVPAAHYHYLHLPTGRSTASKRYWHSPPVQSLQITEKKAIETFRELFDQALRLRLRTDVPWGITLSGGLDSSAIVYEADRILKEQGIQTPMQTFSAIFPDSPADESRFIKIIEKDLNLQAYYSQPLNDFNFNDFEQFLYHQDFPVNSTSSYARWCVFKLVAQSNVKVILNGQGGDEILGGYHHHLHRYIGELIRNGKFARSYKETKAASEIQGKESWPMYKMILKKELAGRGVPDHARGKTLRSRLESDLTSLMIPFMLRYEDRISMAFGIESRVPFLDHKLVEFALQLPGHLKIKDGWQKYILRKAMPTAPETIAFRKDKKGFTTPQRAWVNEYREQFLDYLNYFDKIDLPYDKSALLAENDFGTNNSHKFRYLAVGAWVKTFQASRK